MKIKTIKITVLALIISLATSLLNIVNVTASDDYQNQLMEKSIKANKLNAHLISCLHERLNKIAEYGGSYIDEDGEFHFQI